MEVPLAGHLVTEPFLAYDGDLVLAASEAIHGSGRVRNGWAKLGWKGERRALSRSRTRYPWTEMGSC